MKLKINYIGVLFMTLALGGCYTAPLETEQYFKQVYLVGAALIADGPFVQEVKYSDTESETYVSVATGGSLKVEEDVRVTVDLYPSVIEWYNNKYLSDDVIHYQLMDESAYTMESNTVTIQAGNVYARVPIRIRSEKLHCDSLYVIPLKIVSADLPINEADSALILNVKMVNDYSGDYQMTGKKLETGAEKATSLVGGRALVAVNKNTVRYYHENTSEEVKNAAEWGVNFTVHSDYTVTVTGYDQFVVNDGGGTWDPETKTFDVWYIYTASNGREYRDDLTFVQ